MGKTTAERFWAKVQIGQPDECWEWQAAKDGEGYGKFGIGGRGNVMASHRWVVGCTLGDGVTVQHTCDNPPCCNPRHLRMGTHLDNVADMVAKGRSLKGQNRQVLDADSVRLIRRVYESGQMSQGEIADEFGVSRRQVVRIVNHQCWAMV